LEFASKSLKLHVSILLNHFYLQSGKSKEVIILFAGKREDEINPLDIGVNVGLCFEFRKLVFK